MKVELFDTDENYNQYELVYVLEQIKKTISDSYMLLASEREESVKKIDFLIGTVGTK